MISQTLKFSQKKTRSACESELESLSNRFKDPERQLGGSLDTNKFHQTSRPPLQHLAAKESKIQLLASSLIYSKMSDRAT